MSTLPLIVQLSGAGALLVAAAAKVAAPGRVAATIAVVGLRPAASLARALVAVELAAATALAVHPAGLLTSILVGGLGTAFALTGLTAHRRGITVTCACFGGRSGHPLGLRQVMAWPLWIAVAVLAPSSSLTGADGLLALALLGTAVAVVLAGPVLATVVRDRRALAVAT